MEEIDTVWMRLIRLGLDERTTTKSEIEKVLTVDLYRCRRLDGSMRFESGKLVEKSNDRPS